MTWEQDSFAYAEGYDDDAQRYRGLQTGPRGVITVGDPGLLVRPESARKQIDAELAGAPDVAEETEDTNGDERGEIKDSGEPFGEKSNGRTTPPAAKRYHGSVRLNPTRFGRDASQVADEVIAHLASLLGADVKLTLEIEATIPDGAPEHVVRTVNENTRTLKFDDSGFETE